MYALNLTFLLKYAIIKALHKFKGVNLEEMKNYLIKMMMIILVLSGFINIYKESNNKHYIENTVDVVSLASANVHNEELLVVYEGLTISELSEKLDKVLKSDLAGYGRYIAETSLERNVDPIVATSILLHETGCTWKCSYLARVNYNVGGMRGRNGYMKFDSMEEGIRAFIGNLQKNYYEKGLTTPELMNKKYAENPNWYKNVNHYVKLIKAS